MREVSLKELYLAFSKPRGALVEVADGTAPLERGRTISDVGRARGALSVVESHKMWRTLPSAPIGVTISGMKPRELTPAVYLAAAARFGAGS